MGTPDAAGSGAPDRETDREAGLAAAFAAAFRLGPDAPPAGANEDQPLPDASPPPPAESELDALLEPDSDVEAESATDPAAVLDQAVEEQAPKAPIADIQSQPVAAELQAVPAEAERQPEPEPEGSVAPDAEAALQAEAEPEAEASSLKADAALEAEAEPAAAAEPEAEAAPTTSVSAAEVEAVGSGATAEPAPQAEAEPHAEPEPQAEPEPKPVAAARKRPNRRVLVAGGVVALAAAAGIGTAIAVTSGSSQPAPRTSSARAAAPTVTQAPSAPSAPSAGLTSPAAPIEPAAIAGARAWLNTNIARSQRISADPNLVGELRSAGFTAAHVAPGYPGAPDWRADNVIISTPETRAQAASVPALTAELASSIPVAVFGTGTQSVEARIVFGTNHPDILSVQAQRQDDATNRRLAGEALLRNPRVTVAPVWSTLVSAGGLDLRPAVVIGLIAARTDVAVVAVKVDPAENAAGTPARTVRLSIPPSVLPGILATLPAGYRPDRISSPTQNNTQLTELSWGVTLTPQPTLS